jgi:peptide/nickel transport system permease protein
MKTIILESMLNFILSIIGIILFGSIPFLFSGMEINFFGYFSGLWEFLNKMYNPIDLLYVDQSGVSRELFPTIWEPYTYSIIILLTAFTISIVLSVLLAMGIFLLPDWLIKRIRITSFAFESIPDVWIVVTLQFFIIWFYKQVHILLFPIASYLQQPYFIPILCLSILPTLLCLRNLILSIEEEWRKQYIETAKGKGLSQFHILYRHILPNTVLSLLNHSKQILWFMISNLLIIEILFNIYGINNFMFATESPEVYIFGLLLMFFPIFLLLFFVKIATFKWTGGAREITY